MRECRPWASTKGGVIIDEGVKARAGLGWSWVGCLSGAYGIGDDNSRCIQGDYESPMGADSGLGDVAREMAARGESFLITQQFGYHRTQR